MIGRVIGTYKIEQKLGEGGMGAVYKGVDTMLDREVAIKALRPELSSQTAVVDRFRSEAVTLAKLNHPNIATLYSLIREGDELFMVLEYVRGETLEDVIRRRGRLSVDEVIPAFCQVLDGINHAHEVGIIHRDIKPANIVVMDNGVPKVLDFGIARLLGTNRMTRAGNIIGTLEYMAPEQVRGLETDARSDTYALGMMLYEIITGRAPFDSENEFELMKLQTESLPPAPRTIEPSIPASIEDAIMQSIQKDPDSRFQSAGDFREFLIAAGYSPDTPTKRITGPKPAPPPAPIAAPTVPQPAAAASSTFAAEFKETRLGEPLVVPVPSNGAKETRLPESMTAGPAAAGTFGMTPVAAPSESFFDRLTWLHYAAAGTVGVIVLGVGVLVPIVGFSGGFFSGTPKEPPADITNANRGTKAIAASTPTPAPVVRPTSTPETRVEEPSPVAPIPTPTPTSVERPVVPPKTADPPPAKRAEKKKAPSSPGRKSPSARCALTGDC